MNSKLLICIERERDDLQLIHHSITNFEIAMMNYSEQFKSKLKNERTQFQAIRSYSKM